MQTHILFCTVFPNNVTVTSINAMVANYLYLLGFAFLTKETKYCISLQALFRALKAKHSTPKYGLIYHASLIGQAAPKHKGKISRSLAAKTALAIRYDALGDGEDNSIGLESRVKVFTVCKHLFT